MTNICHLIDDTAGFAQRVSIGQLVDHLPAESYRQTIAASTAAAARAMTMATDRYSTRRLTPFFRSLRPFVQARQIAHAGCDLIHAWGIEAAVTSRLAGVPGLVVTISDPAIGKAEMRSLNRVALSGRFAIACTTQFVRQRLIAGGIAPQSCVVIRPAVDFNPAQPNGQSKLAKELGLYPGRATVIVAEPISLDSGAFESFWSSLLRGQITKSIQTIVPGNSAEKNRLQRFARGLPGDSKCMFPGEVVPFEHLVSLADIMMFAPSSPASTEAIPLAMANRTAIVATNVECVRELISHEVNGQLVEVPKEGSIIAALSRALLDSPQRCKLLDAAQAKARELFDASRYLDQYHQLYRNALTGKAAYEGICEATGTR